MDFDEDSLELVERRLSERVENQVRDRLFRSYRVAWGVAFALLGLFGYNVVAGLEDHADKIAGDAVQPAVENANAAAAEAERQLAQLLARLDAAEAFQSRREENLIESEYRLSQNQTRIDAIARETDERLEAIVRNLDETEAQLTAIGKRSKEVAGIGNVSDLAADLQRVADRVETMSQDLIALEGQVTGETADTGAAQYEPLALTTAPPSARPPSEAAGSASGTVYLQFAGVAREVAQLLSEKLKQLGYTMPGEERTPFAAELHEVRYFFEGDADRARRLVDDINRVLAETGYRTDVTLKDFTGYYGGKPREGTLELWLQPTPAT